MTPELAGSSQLLSRVALVPPPVHETPNLPYQSEVILEHEAYPPCNRPIIRPAGSKTGEPDEPPSVVVPSLQFVILQ